MAPSGAGRRCGGLALVWLLLGALAWSNAESSVVASDEFQCNIIDDVFNKTLQSVSQALSPAKVRLAAGCNILARNFICTPITKDLVVDGASDGQTSSWDLDLDVFQFSIDGGVTVTLQNLALTRALVFPSGDTKLQPAIFHIRSGARLLLRNVTVETLCTTINYYSQALGLNQLTASSSAPAAGAAGGRQSLFVQDLTAGGMSLQGVALTCDPQLTIPGPVDLYIHTARMLAAFAGAANELTLPATIRLMENITLPYLPPLYIGTDKLDPRSTLISYNITISGMSDNGSLTYIDANYTAAWLYVQPPATLTLRGLVITRPRPAVWAQNGIVSGLLAGAMPLFMVAPSPITSVPPTLVTPPRKFENLTVLVPQYEVTQVSYWCNMLNVVQPEFSSAADFLRSLVWSAECDTLDSTSVMLRRISSSMSLYLNVRLTSVGIAGVPFDPLAPPPSATDSYEYVYPPLSLASTAKEWLDGVARLLPQDTNASPPPSAGAATSQSSSYIVPSRTPLPILVLLNGTVTLSAGDVAVVGGGKRTVRSSVIVTSVRKKCGPEGPCPCAVLDLGNLTDALRLEGSSTLVMFQRVTLRNVGGALVQQLGGVLPAGQTGLGFFQFERTSAARVVFHGVTVELSLELFGALLRALTLAARPGNVEVIGMNATLIQVASFHTSGARGSFVNFTLQGYSGGEVPYMGPAEEGGSRSQTPVIIGGCVGGAVVLLLLLLALGFWARRRRCKSRPAAAAADKSEADAAERVDLELSACSLGGGGDDDGESSGRHSPKEAAAASAGGCLAGRCDSIDGSAGNGACVARAGHAGFAGGAPAAAAAVAGCRRAVLADRDSPHCTPCTTGMTGTTSELTSSDAMLAPPPLHAAGAATASTTMNTTTAQSTGGCHVGALVAQLPTSVPPLALLPCSAVGPTPRRAFSLARSVPEDDQLLEEPDPSPCSGSCHGTGHGTAGTAGSAGFGSATATCGSGGGACITGRRCLLDSHSMGLATEFSSCAPTPLQRGGSFGGAGAGGAGASAERGAPRLLPHLLEPAMDTISSSGGGGGGPGPGASSVGGSGLSGVVVLGPCSSSSRRRVSRALSCSRAYLALSDLTGSGAGGSSGHRPPGLRVRALGRSPSRPSRSLAASSSSGQSTTLPAPQPAVLAAMDLSAGALAAPGSARLGRSAAVSGAGGASGVGVGSGATAGPCSSGSGGGGLGTAYGISARFRGDRVPHLYASRTQPPVGVAGPPGCEGGGVAPQQRREPSQSALVGSAAGMASELCDPAATTTSHSAHLMATAGTLDPHSHHFDADSSSPGASMSISKIPEPASEVQRLILELSAQGTDQLVILEPIGRGGYGTVYKGVWRNLDVAVKTVLFQDRANFTTMPSPSSGPGLASSLPQSHVARTGIITERIDEQDPSTSRHDSEASAPHLTLSHLAACRHGSGAHSEASVQHGSAGGGGPGSCAVTSTSTHNWALASQQAANSGSLPTVNAVVAAAAPCLGPLGVASQQRAVLEAAVSCSVAHPNVVATYHYDITPVRPSGVVCSGGMLVSDGLRTAASAALGSISDWKLYLVQEFCDGGSLAGALDNRLFHDINSMPNLALTLCTLADIARGMAHIHSRSIVHGDLNPTNILLRSAHGSNGGFMPMWNRVGSIAQSGVGAVGAVGAGAGAAVGSGSGSATPGASAISHAATLRQELGVSMVAKVADFGLCGMLAPGKRHISNAQRGTPFYTAPETVATGTLTKASDVYSFGVIAWEVYTGRPPFQHLPEQGFARDSTFPRMPNHAPATFANLTLACLSADPDSRPTFQQILDRLMALQTKLAASLQQRLSRLVASSQGTILGSGGTLSPSLTPPNASSHATAVAGANNPSQTVGLSAAVAMAAGSSKGGINTNIGACTTPGGSGAAAAPYSNGLQPYSTYYSQSALPPGPPLMSNTGGSGFVTSSGSFGLFGGSPFPNSMPNIFPNQAGPAFPTQCQIRFPLPASVTVPGPAAGS